MEKKQETNNLKTRFEDYCIKNGYVFNMVDNVRPYDDTTLFCPAGMQQYKSTFRNTEITGKTICNIQPCIRLNDLDEIGDGTHLLYFNMIGMFSFRDLTLETTINFWIKFIEDELKLKIDYVTIHPDKMGEWEGYYPNHLVKSDDECIWSDGEVSSYCTEFYINDVEIGNIVNNGGDSIDVGFGYERLNSFLVKEDVKTPNEILIDAIMMIINSGYKPSPNKQGYILRKLITKLHKNGGTLEHKYFEEEVKRHEKIAIKYDRLKDKFKDKPKEWWYDTHGINLSEFL